MDINNGQRPFFYPSGNYYRNVNNNPTPKNTYIPDSSLERTRFYHVPTNLGFDNQANGYNDNRFGIFTGSNENFYPDLGNTNGNSNWRNRPREDVMFPKLFGEDRDIKIEIEPRVPNFDTSAEEYDIDNAKVLRKGVNIDVSPPFGKAYIPQEPSNDRLEPDLIIDGIYTSTVEPDIPTYNTSDNSGLLYNLSNFYANETDLNIHETSPLCGGGLDNLGNNVYLYGLGLLIVIAVLLNGLQFAVFRTKPLRKFAFSAYLSAVAVTDSFALFSHIPRRWMNILYQTLDWGLGVTVYDTNRIACRGLTYFSYVARFLSAWIVVALAAERLMVSKDPYKRSKARKPRTAIHLLLGLSVISLVLNCHVIFTWDVVSKENDSLSVCSPSLESEMLSLFLTVFSLFSIVALPFMVTLILTVIMLQNLQNNSWKLRPRKISAMTLNKLQFERKSILMVSLVTGVHALLSIPFIIAWIVMLGQHFSPPEDPCQMLKTYAAKDITEIVYMANCAFKFVFCVFCGTKIVSYK